MRTDSDTDDVACDLRRDAEIATARALKQAAGKQRRAHEIDLTVKWDFYGYILADDGSKAASMTPAAKRIAYILLSRYNHDDGHCFPGTESLMADTGYSRSQVMAALGALARHEWFTVKKRWNSSNLYTPNLAKVGLTGIEGTRIPAVKSPENRTTEVRKTGLEGSGKVDPNPCKGTHINETHVSEQDESAPRSVLQNERVGRASDGPTGFDREWDAFSEIYPGYLNGDQWKGYFINVRRSGVPAAVLMTGVHAYIRHLDSGVIDAPMHVAKYLSESRWEDDNPE